MSSPFPGMDLYLEAPEIWRGFHHSLADEIKAQLNTVLSPRYYADVEVRTVLEEVGIAATKTVYPSDSRSVLKILCDLCRTPLSEPSDDPFVACDATCTAGMASILGTKPLLASAEGELRHSHGTGASAIA